MNKYLIIIDRINQELEHLRNGYETLEDGLVANPELGKAAAKEVIDQINAAKGLNDTLAGKIIELEDLISSNASRINRTIDNQLKDLSLEILNARGMYSSLHEAIGRSQDINLKIEEDNRQYSLSVQNESGVKIEEFTLDSGKQAMIAVPKGNVPSMQSLMIVETSTNESVGFGVEDVSVPLPDSVRIDNNSNNVIANSTIKRLDHGEFVGILSNNNGYREEYDNTLFTTYSGFVGELFPSMFSPDATGVVFPSVKTLSCSVLFKSSRFLDSIKVYPFLEGYDHYGYIDFVISMADGSKVNHKLFDDTPLSNNRQPEDFIELKVDGEVSGISMFLRSGNRSAGRIILKRIDFMEKVREGTYPNSILNAGSIQMTPQALDSIHSVSSIFSEHVGSKVKYLYEIGNLLYKYIPREITFNATDLRTLDGKLYKGSSLKEFVDRPSKAALYKQIAMPSKTEVVYNSPRYTAKDEYVKSTAIGGSETTPIKDITAWMPKGALYSDNGFESRMQGSVTINGLESHFPMKPGEYEVAHNEGVVLSYKVDKLHNNVLRVHVDSKGDKNNSIVVADSVRAHLTAGYATKYEDINLGNYTFNGRNSYRYVASFDGQGGGLAIIPGDTMDTSQSSSGKTWDSATRKYGDVGQNSCKLPVTVYFMAGLSSIAELQSVINQDMTIYDGSLDYTWDDADDVLNRFESQPHILSVSVAGWERIKVKASNFVDIEQNQVNALVSTDKSKWYSLAYDDPSLTWLSNISRMGMDMYDLLSLSSEKIRAFVGDSDILYLAIKVKGSRASFSNITFETGTSKFESVTPGNSEIHAQPINVISQATRTDYDKVMKNKIEDFKLHVMMEYHDGIPPTYQRFSFDYGQREIARTLTSTEANQIPMYISDGYAKVVNNSADTKKLKMAIFSPQNRSLIDTSSSEPIDKILSNVNELKDAYTFSRNIERRVFNSISEFKNKFSMPNMYPFLMNNLFMMIDANSYGKVENLYELKRLIKSSISHNFPKITFSEDVGNSVYFDEQYHGFVLTDFGGVNETRYFQFDYFFDVNLLSESITFFIGMNIKCSHIDLINEAGNVMEILNEDILFNGRANYFKVDTIKLIDRFGPDGYKKLKLKVYVNHADSKHSIEMSYGQNMNSLIHSTSGNYTSYPVDRLIDNNHTTYWRENAAGVHTYFYLRSPIILKRIRFRRYSNTSYTPKNFHVYGSYDGSSFETITSGVVLPWNGTAYEWLDVDIPNDNRYIAYRIYFYNPDSTAYIYMADVEFWGITGFDPDLFDLVKSIGTVQDYKHMIDVEPIDYDAYMKQFKVSIPNDGIKEILLDVPYLPLGEVVLNSVVQEKDVDYEFVAGSDGSITFRWLSEDFSLETDDDLEINMR